MEFLSLIIILIPLIIAFIWQPWYTFVFILGIFVGIYLTCVSLKIMYSENKQEVIDMLEDNE